MKERILSKLRTYNYKLTNYELDYIKNNEAFKFEIIDTINNSDVLWNEDLFNIIYTCIDIDLFSLNQNIVYNFLNCQINYTYLSRVNFMDSLNYLTDPILKEELINKYNNKIKDSNYLKNICIEENDLIYLLDNKEYKLISKINNLSTFNRPSLNFITRFHNEYPFTEYDYPKFLFSINDHIFLKYIEYLDVESLLIGLVQKRLPPVYFDNLYNQLIEKVNQSISLENEDFNEFLNNENYHHFINSLDKSQLEQLALLFLEKHSLLFYEYLPQNEEITKKIEIILNDSTTQNLIFAANESIYKLTDNIINSLSKNGQFYFLIDQYNKCKDLEHRLSIYNNIYITLCTNPKFYKEELSTMCTSDIPSVDILNLVLNAGYVKRIIINNNKPSYYFPIMKYLSKYQNVEIEFTINSINSINYYLQLALINGNIEMIYSIVNYNHLPDSSYECISQYLDNSKIAELFGNCCIDKVLHNQSMLNYFLDHQLYIFELISTAIARKCKNEFFNENTYNKIKLYLANYYNIQVNSLDAVEKVVGPSIIKYLDSKNVLSILQLDSNEINKILELFNIPSYELDDVEAIYDAIMQHNYSISNPEVFNMYNNLINNPDNVKYAMELLLYLDDKIITEINKKYPNILNSNVSKFKMIEELVDIINFKSVDDIVLTKNKTQEYVDAFHEMIDYYILKKREKYRLTYKDYIYEDIKVPYKYDAKNIIDQGANYALQNYNLLLCGNRSFIEALQIKMNINIDDVKEILINYSLGILSQEEHIKIKKFAKVIIIENYDYFKKNYLKEFENKLRKIYYVESKQNNIMEILNHINIEQFKKVLENDEIYVSLKKILNTKKIVIIPKYIKTFLRDNAIDFTYQDRDEMNFINYFYNIYNREKQLKKDININYPMIFKYGSLYNGLSSIYSQILGQEDSELISLNPGFLRAHNKTEKAIRLNEACELKVNNFKRKYVTVPAFNEVFSDDNRKVRVIVGNFTESYNLTHGERTDSCMRIGGIGETLYNFALMNENGFHITLLEADTNRYLSRATCFRNGNSVFINGLRHSLNYEEYDDECISKILKQACEKLISYSTNSSYPIDNVFIYEGYAITELNQISVNLGVDTIKQNLKGFYSDIGSNSVVLNTRDKDKLFVPLTFEKVRDRYLPARIQTNESQNLHDAYTHINRVHIINKLLKIDKQSKNESIMTTGVYLTPLEIDNGFIDCYYNLDWYIYIDNDFNVISECIDIDKRAEEEMDYYQELLLRKYNTARIRK